MEHDKREQDALAWNPQQTLWDSGSWNPFRHQFSCLICVCVCVCVCVHACVYVHKRDRNREWCGPFTICRWYLLLSFAGHLLWAGHSLKCFSCIIILVTALCGRCYLHFTPMRTEAHLEQDRTAVWAWIYLMSDSEHLTTKAHGPTARCVPAILCKFKSSYNVQPICLSSRISRVPNYKPV